MAWLPYMPANRLETAWTGHTVAGVIDAEAHFCIADMNGGSSSSCSMTLCARDDDAGLLHALARFTGLGVVRRKDVRGNPQAAWSVYRKDDAAELVRLLNACPLRSRKRLDFAMWRQAVAAWLGDEPDRFDRMRGLQCAIRTARTYRTPSAQAEVPRLDPSGLDAWLAGFVAGEAYLEIRSGIVRFTVHLRADDLPLLQAIRLATGLGSVGGPYVNRASSPSAKWSVCSTSDVLALVRRLDGRVPGRKAAEFEVWRRAVEIRADASLTRPAQRRLIDEAEREIKRLRRYWAPRTPLPSAKSRRGQQMFEQNLRWLPLLRSWAAVESGALTGAAYERARREGWPTRNTLATRFGSWYDALAAAGLSDRAAMLPDERDRRVAGGVQARDERRQMQRARVIEAVQRCAADLGRPPGPTQYERWRLHNAPDAPSFGTAYRVFPGGWSELRAAVHPSRP